MNRGRALMLAVVAGTVVGSSAWAGPNPRAAHRLARPVAGGADAIVVLSNNITGDGYLRVDPDDFGAVTVWAYPDNYDYYDPAGALGVSNPMFAGSVFIFDPVTADRVALGQSGRNLAVNYPGSFITAVTS